MRIIAGKWRRRQIAAPVGQHTRPILDRAKTVLFDILGNRLCEPGRLPPLAVLDLFAGSGALGLEALSRGSRYCLFIEQDHASAAVLRENLTVLGIVDEAQVIKANAAHCVFNPPPGPDGMVSCYDLVFVDPPYRMLTGPTPHADIRRLLQKLAFEPIISPSAIIVVRHPLQSATEVPDLSPLLERERRDIGKMTFRFMGRPETGEDLDRQEPPCDER